MLDFLQSYGIWIVLGLLFLFMLRGHARGGGGCCGGDHQHDKDSEKVTEAIKVNDGQEKKSGSGCH